VKDLKRQIHERLKTAKWCVAFESDLENIWPRDDIGRKKRATSIEAFAKRNGWSVTILDPGIRATFRTREKTSVKKSALLHSTAVSPKWNGL
jgi:hypothetical protein